MLMKVMETSDEFIVERTGMRRRRYAGPGMAASDLAALACRDAVADAGLSMDQIDMLVMNTITPDHADPGCAFSCRPSWACATCLCLTSSSSVRG